MMKFFRLSKYFKHYSSLLLKPKFIHVLFLWPNMLFRGPLISFRNFRRFVAANQLPGTLQYSDQNFPAIELMICAAKKDFFLLERCIFQAIRNSVNSISNVTIIVPASQIDLCWKNIPEISHKYGSKVQVLNEDFFISEKSRDGLRNSLGEFYGWGLQQFLTVAFIIQSKSLGVLVVNADTLILQKRTWLGFHGVQELLVSSEYHKPYYSVLNKINPDLGFPKFTFICHQMLFQPDLLKQFLSRVNVSDIDEFIDLILSNADCTLRSPFCVEFEFYAQSLYFYKKEFVKLIRFANVPFQLSSDKIMIFSELNDLEEEQKYNSVSHHSWI